MSPHDTAVILRGAADMREFSSHDEIFLRLSDRRELSKVFAGMMSDPKCPRDSHRLLSRILVGLGYDEGDVSDVVEAYAECAYGQMSATEREDSGYRFWSDETMGCRL
jgi:hypothetical protein